METAYAYLSSRMRTVYEVEKHLKDKGFNEEEITETVNDLIGLRYLDDYQYAMRYYEYNREKRRGTLRASRELSEKGIDTDTINNAREDFLFSEGIDEFEDALDIANRELSLKKSDLADSGQQVQTDERMAASIARKLENKGFSRDIIFKVLSRLRSGSEDE